MLKVLKFIRIFLEFIRCSPHLVLLYLHKNSGVIKADTRRWQQIMKNNYEVPSGFIYSNLLVGFIFLLSFYPEFRNLFYYRVGGYRYLLNIFCPKVSTLLIQCDEIGEGLYIQHGFASTINAKSIGKNCTVNQQVTIAGFPTLLDNVKVYSGAVIIGTFTIGNNTVIAANATVFNDVPDNCTVYPAPSRIMKWGNKAGPKTSTENNSNTDEISLLIN
jgi:serine O-acetyltransferase